jgi:anti-sigma factor RsiW
VKGADRPPVCLEERLLSGYVDGELELREMARVRDHLDQCAGCARAEAELRRLVAATRELPAAGEPPEALWGQIAGALDAEDASARRGSSRRGRLFMMVAAAVVVLVGAGTAGIRPWRRVAAAPSSEQALLDEARRQFEAAEAQYRSSVAVLRKIAERERPRWQPELARAYRQNLQAIDEAIERSRAAARQAGTDPAAMESLFGAYRRQINFLQESIERGAASAREVEAL